MRRLVHFSCDAAPADAANGELLREIRDRYRYALDYWHDVGTERNADMKYICGEGVSPKWPWRTLKRAWRWLRNK